jgi:hypothetical protein
MAAIAATIGLLVGLVALPRETLGILWYIVIPSLPAVFFINPILWRGICPLASANELGNRFRVGEPPSPRTVAALGIAGLFTFHLLIPARHFLFNVNGSVLALTIVAVLACAVVLGAAFAVRSGFCNALCPILPVELLYGQAPLIQFERGRCTACSVCTPRGCADLAPGKALTQLLGSTRHSIAWLRTPFGVFAAALPGFIVAYGNVPDVGTEAALLVYATSLAWSLLSIVFVWLAVAVTRCSAASALRAVAAASGAAYYWFAGPNIALRFHAPSLVARSIQLAGLALVAVWFVNARRAKGGTTPVGG